MNATETPTSTKRRIVVPVDEKARTVLSMKADGPGGFQYLTRSIQEGMTQYPGVLVLTREDAEKMLRYHAEYGGGGFQGRLEQVVVEVKREIEKVGPLPSLFDEDD